MKKIKCAVLTSSSSRTSGGLFYSVRALHDSISKNNILTKVFAAHNKYSNEDSYLWSKSLNLTMFKVLGPKSFGYLPNLLRSVKNYNPNIIHVHGLWMFNNLAGLLLKNKQNHLIVSPRGMLDKWALSRSRWKKTIAGFLYTNKMLRQADCIHALNIDEYRAIRSYGLTQPVIILPNGIELNLADKNKNIQARVQWGKDVRVLLFLGRLHPKKNISNLVYGFKKARELGLAADWILVIAGWDQSGYINKIRLLVDKLQLNDLVIITGPQYNENKIWSYINADAFILPSYSEGLPVSILEAWSYRLPVIMTRECNLPEAFTERAAIEVSTDQDSIARGIIELSQLSVDNIEKIVENAESLLVKKFSWGCIGSDMAKTYQWLTGEGYKPDCVHLN